MQPKVLLVLNALDSDDDQVAIKPFGEGRDVRIKGPSRDGDDRLINAAFLHAIDHGDEVKALQVLSSNLYHWGRQDIIISGPGKAAFLTYVRQLVIERGRQKKNHLQHLAQKMGVSLEVQLVESEDPVATIIKEAGTGYDTIFLPKERRKLFPLSKRHTLEDRLKNAGFSNLLAC